MRSMRSAGGPDWSLPEVRHQAWVTAALATVRRALPQDQATALIARFLDNDPWAETMLFSERWNVLGKKSW